MSAGASNGRDRGASAPRQVKCPQCGRPAALRDNPWRPFCSERCKLIDLGEWAEGGYAIPGEAAPLPDDEKR